MPTRPAEPEDEEDDGAAEREAEERATAERAEQEAKEARELKERQAQEQQQRAKAAAAAAERKRKEKEKLDREEREREERARREKEDEDEGAAEETRPVADDKQSTKSAPRTVRSPKPEGRKSVEKRMCPPSRVCSFPCSLLIRRSSRPNPDARVARSHWAIPCRGGIPWVQEWRASPAQEEWCCHRSTVREDVGRRYALCRKDVWSWQFFAKGW